MPNYDGSVEHTLFEDNDFLENMVNSIRVRTHTVDNNIYKEPLEKGCSIFFINTLSKRNNMCPFKNLKHFSTVHILNTLLDQKGLGGYYYEKPFYDKKISSSMPAQGKGINIWNKVELSENNKSNVNRFISKTFDVHNFKIRSLLNPIIFKNFAFNLAFQRTKIFQFSENRADKFIYFIEEHLKLKNNIYYLDKRCSINNKPIPLIKILPFYLEYFVYKDKCIYPYQNNLYNLYILFISIAFNIEKLYLVGFDKSNNLINYQYILEYFKEFDSLPNIIHLDNKCDDEKDIYSFLISNSNLILTKILYAFIYNKFDKIVYTAFARRVEFIYRSLPYKQITYKDRKELYLFILSNPTEEEKITYFENNLSSLYLIMSGLVK